MKPGAVMRMGDFQNNYDFERFGTQPVAVQEHVVAMSTHSHLLMAHLGGVLEVSTTGSNNGEETHATNAVLEQPVIGRVAIEYTNKDPDDRVNTIAWITPHVIACGFESGLVQGYADNGDRLFQFRGQTESCVASLKTTTEGPNHDDVLWILFESGQLVAVLLAQALLNNFTEAFVFFLRSVQQANDFALVPYIETAAQSFALFDQLGDTINANDPAAAAAATSMIPTPFTKRLIVIGGQPTMSVFLIDFWTILTQERKRLKQEASSTLSTSSLTKSFFSIVQSFTGSSSSSSSSSGGSSGASGGNTSNGSGATDDDAQSDATNAVQTLVAKKRARELVTFAVVISDEKRRMIRLSLDPLGVLCACADGLGRVTLFDLVHVHHGHHHAKPFFTSPQLATGSSVATKKTRQNSSGPTDDTAATSAASADAAAAAGGTNQQQLLAIRLWKGVRDAHFGWIIESDTATAELLRARASSMSTANSHSHKQSSASYFHSHATPSSSHDEGSGGGSGSGNSPPMLRLAIFAPQLGLVSVYQMRNGPCVRVIPVGYNVKMLRLPQPIFHEHRNALETVVVLRCDASQQTLDIASLASTAQSETQLAMLVDLLMDEQGDGADPNASTAVDEGVRRDTNELLGYGADHDDLQSSIQEAWRLQRLSLSTTSSSAAASGRTGTAAATEVVALVELARLLRLFHTQQWQYHHHPAPASAVPTSPGEQQLAPYPPSSAASATTAAPAAAPTATTSSASSTATDAAALPPQPTNKIECQLLKLLHKATSVAQCLTYVRVLEFAEVTNFAAFAAQHHHPLHSAYRDVEDNPALYLDAAYMRSHHPEWHWTSRRDEAGAEDGEAASLSSAEKTPLFVYHSHVHSPNSPSSSHAHSQRPLIVAFSVAFHLQVIALLQRLWATEFDGAGDTGDTTAKRTPPDALRHLPHELSWRRQALDTYQRVVDLRRQVTRDIFPRVAGSAGTGGSGGGSGGGLSTWVARYGGDLPKNVQEEAAAICRQQSPRAEALCWTMRAYKLAQTAHHAAGNATTAAGTATTTAATGTGTGVAAGATSPVPSTSVSSSRAGSTVVTPIAATGGSVTGVSPYSSVSVGGGHSPLLVPRPSHAMGHGPLSPLSPSGGRQKHRLVALRETIQWQHARHTQQSPPPPPGTTTVSHGATLGSGGVGVSGSRSVSAASSPMPSTLATVSAGNGTTDVSMVSVSLFLQLFHVTAPSPSSSTAASASASAAVAAAAYRRVFLSHLLTTPTTRRLRLLGDVDATDDEEPIDAAAASQSPGPGAGHGLGLFLDGSARRLLCDVLFTPLCGDFNALHSFNGLMKRLDSRLHGPLSIVCLLPAVFRVFATQSSSALVADFLVKKNNTSPLQRWLRDHLLTFQVALSEYKTTVANNQALLSDPPSTAARRRRALHDPLLRAEPYATVDASDMLALCQHVTLDLLQTTSSGASSSSGAATVVPSSSAVASVADVVRAPFGDFVQRLFRPTLTRPCRTSARLEHVASFCALLLETLQAVHDQIERRSYGSDAVTRTIRDVETLLRQTRVVLLVKSRALTSAHTSSAAAAAAAGGGTGAAAAAAAAAAAVTSPVVYDDVHDDDDDNDDDDNDRDDDDAENETAAALPTTGDSGDNGDHGSRCGVVSDAYATWNLAPHRPLHPSQFTVASLASGRLSLYRLLAQDTLDFGVRVNAALDHEDKCRDVFLHTLHLQQQALLQQQLQAQQQAQQLASSPSLGVGGGGGGGGFGQLPSVSSTSSAYLRTSSSSEENSGGGTSSGGGNEALLAWGKSADRRWRDLLALALTEDAIVTAAWTAPPTSSSSSSSTSAASSSASTTASSLRRKRKPLLLYFPYHNHSLFLGAYRALLTAAQWAARPQVVEGLVVVCEHVFEIAKPWRGLVAWEVYLRYVWPVYQGLVWLEEDNCSGSGSGSGSSSGGVGNSGVGSPAVHSGGNSASVSRGSASPVRPTSTAAAVAAAMGLRSPSTSTSSSLSNAARGAAASTATGAAALDPTRAQQLMVLMKDPALVKAFVSQTVELLTYVLESFATMHNAGPSGTTTTTGSGGGAATTTATALPLLPWSDTAATLLDLLAASSGSGDGSATLVGTSTSPAAMVLPTDTCWPPIADVTLGQWLPERFLRWPLHRDTLHYHICVAYTLCLRFQCALRGVAPSLLLGRRLSWHRYHRWQQRLRLQAAGQLDDTVADVDDTDDVTDGDGGDGSGGGGGTVELLSAVWLQHFPPSNHHQHHSDGHHHRNSGLTTQRVDDLAMQSGFIRRFLLHNDLAHLPVAQIHARTQFLRLAFSRMMLLNQQFHQQQQQQQQQAKATGAAAASAAVKVTSKVTEVRAQVLYHLGKLWGFPLDVIRLLHLQCLLEDGDDVHNEVETMVMSQFDDVRVVSDALLSYARYHLGQLLLRVERLPQYGPVLAAMDSEALLWAKQAHGPSNASGSAAGMTTGAATAAAATAAAGAKTVDVTVIRRVVLYLQALLLNAPLKDREAVVAVNVEGGASAVLPPYAQWARRYLDAPTAASASASTDASSSGFTMLQLTVYHSWHERKARCDALLSLCNAIVTATLRLQQQIQQQQQQQQQASLLMSRTK